MTPTLKSPFPYFGGKSRAAAMIWEGLGDVQNYVEPFFGSGAVLLDRPSEPGIETVNDLDGLLSNFWRAISRDPEAVAAAADYPVDECTLHARHCWLVSHKPAITARLMGDPDWFDAKAAGYWVWGQGCWIGRGWCEGKGPWQSIDGVFTDTRKLPHLGTAGAGVNRQLPHLGNAWTGVHRKRLHLGDAWTGVHRKRLHLGDAGRGVHRKRLHLGDAGSGHTRRLHLIEYFGQLADRLRYVRVCCGDWFRVCGPCVTTGHGTTGVLLDPPYSGTAGRDNALYSHDSTTVAHAVREWAIENGDNPLLRIALCGYEGEHVMPDSWRCVPWKARGGYGSQSKTANLNKHRERVWFSPHCVEVAKEQFAFA